MQRFTLGDLGSAKGRWLVIFTLLSFSIAALSIFIVKQASLNHNLVALAITLDLTVIIPFVYYVTIVRQLNISSISIVLVFLAMVGLATLVIPNESHFYLNQIKKSIILLESILLIYLILKIRKIIEHFKIMNTLRKDFVYNLNEAMKSVIGQSMATAILAGEICMLKYGLFGWLASAEAEIKDCTFTTYKKTGYTAVWIALLFIIILETFIMHLLLSDRIPGLSIGVTIVSIYGLVFMLADYVALIKRPIIVKDGQLYVRVGMRWNVILNLRQIKSVESIGGIAEKDITDLLDCSLLKNPNVLITVTRPVTVSGLYGIRRTMSRIALSLDDESDFFNIVNKNRLNQ